MSIKNNYMCKFKKNLNEIVTDYNLFLSHDK